MFGLLLVAINSVIGNALAFGDLPDRSTWIVASIVGIVTGFALLVTGNLLWQRARIRGEVSGPPNPFRSVTIQVLG